jgi:hypothetical protein
MDVSWMKQRARVEERLRVLMWAQEQVSIGNED